MKKLLLASAALMALSMGGNAVVQAADMPVKAVAPIPVWSWSGCYVGGQVGFKWGRSRHTSGGLTNGVANGTAGQDIAPSFNLNGPLGGFEGGCQVQWGSWVLGVEVDGSFVAAEGQANGFGAPTPFSQNWVHKTSERWLATARGRLGYAAWNNWLWYVTGGGAWAGIDVATANIVGNPAQVAIDDRNSRGGWVVGYGTEYHVSHNWSVKAETLYTDFGTYRTLDFTPACGGSVNCTNRDVRLSEWIWRVGMNYKFDWGKSPVGKSPVVAKY